MDSLEQKYAQTLENSNLSISYFQKLVLRIQQQALLPRRLEFQKGPFLVTLKPRKEY